jgi:uncharacterized protein YcfL
MKKLILLAALLLASCSSNSQSTIEGFYKNDANTLKVVVSESVMNCPLTSWKETLTMGSTRVERTVKTECVNSYNVEVVTIKNQVYDTKVFEYRLTDHKVNILVNNSKVILSKNESTTLVEYLKELNK